MTTQRPFMTTLVTTSKTRRLGGALLALALGLILPASALAENFIVNSNADTSDGMCEELPGDCTLREAIAAANGNGESDTITFDLDEGDREILLGGTQLTIANDVAGLDLNIDGDVDGNGTPDITVDADERSRVFLIDTGAEASLEGLVITGGSLPFGDGGGIFNRGTLTVAYSTISGNHALSGGGIRNEGGMLTVTNSTISGNSSDGGSGAISNRVGTLTVTNSTISGNSGAIAGIVNDGTLMVESSTISGNSGTRVGGILNQLSRTLEIKSTIVAGNTPQDCARSTFTVITSLGFNLDGDGTCGFTEDDDHQNVAVADVLVTANGAPLLADNGGPTQTIALLDTDTNPAIDAIDDCTDIDGMPVPTDQRGVARPQPAGGDCDIGAFELVQAASVTIADVIELFDDAVADGTLTGAGPGNSAAGRLNALRNMLLTAGELLEQSEIDAACTQLQAAAERTDGASPPPDFVQGAAAGDLFEAITAVQDELGCFD